MVRKLEIGRYLVNERYLVIRNEQEKPNTPTAWIVKDYMNSDDWIYEGCTKRECVEWCKK